MVGYIEAVTGVGLILGPLIGSLLFELGGYRFIFFSFGSLFVFASFFIKMVFGENIDRMGDIKDSLSKQSSGTHRRTRRRHQSTENDDYNPVEGEQSNTRDNENDDNFQQQQSEEDEIQNSAEMDQMSTQVQIGTFELLSYPKFLMASLSGTLGYFLYGFMEPILAFRVKEFGLTQFQIGIFFIVMPVFYIPTSVFVQKVPNGV